MRLQLGRLSLGLVVPASVLLGHAVGYGVGSGGHGHATTAHGYLSVATAGAVVLALAGVLVAAGGSHRTARPPVRALPLVGLQAGAFVVLEIIERAVAGEAPSALLGFPPLWAGLAAQGVAALLAVALVRSAATAGTRLVMLLTRAPWPLGLTAAGVLPWGPAALDASVLAGPAPARGPPRG